jgi:hypothetical protein
MKISKPRHKLLGLGLGVGIVAGCGGISRPPVPSPNAEMQRPVITASNGTSRQRFSPKHLYIAQGDDIAGKVYRYRLNSNGLPSTKPDGVLHLDFTFPGGIAIGPDGDLYVASSGSGNDCGHKCFVDVFAPGASGRAKPVRVLNIPKGPGFIAVDQQGYLDVRILELAHDNIRQNLDYDLTYVYSPNASGNEGPIKRLHTPAGVAALAASDGLVYIETDEKWVQTAAEHSKTGPPQMYTYPYYSANAVAVDQGQLYAEVLYPAASSLSYVGTEIFKLNQPSTPIRTIVGLDCLSSGAVGYGMAVFQEYLFEGCISGGGEAGDVQVYDSTQSGEQHSIMRLPGGNVGVAIGP